MAILKALLLLKIADILQISSLFEAMGRRIEAGGGQFFQQNGSIKMCKCIKVCMVSTKKNQDF